MSRLCYCFAWLFALTIFPATTPDDHAKQASLLAGACFFLLLAIYHRKADG